MAVIKYIERYYWIKICNRVRFDFKLKKKKKQELHEGTANELMNHTANKKLDGLNKFQLYLGLGTNTFR